MNGAHLLAIVTLMVVVTYRVPIAHALGFRSWAHRRMQGLRCRSCSELIQAVSR